MKQKILISNIQVGSRYSEAIWDKKDNILLPARHSIHQKYLEEWIEDSEYVLSYGEVIEDLEGQEELLSELPGYIDKETRVLLQEYYESIDILKELYQNIMELSYANVQKIAAPWVAYTIKKTNLSILLKVPLYAILPEKDYCFIHNMDVMLVSLGIYKQYYKTASVSDLTKLALGAILCDIGMILLPRDLTSREDISDQQKRDIQKHTLLGYKFLVTHSELPPEIALPSLEHHERPDGSGYPNKLKGDQLHPNSIIISLADIFTAQLHSRSFKDSRIPVEILKDFVKTVMPIFPNTYYSYVAAFVSFVTIYPISSILELDNGEVVIVTKTYPEFPTRPKVLVLLDTDKKPITTFKEFKLSDVEYQNINIVGTYSRSSLQDINKNSD